MKEQVMTPEEDIKILTHRDCPEEDTLFKGYALAVKLCIEALKKIALLSPKGEKPELLSPEEIVELFRLEFGEKAKVTINLSALDLEDDMVYYLDALRYIAQAQYNALVAYYEPLIQQKQNVIDDASNKLGEVEEKLVELIQKQKALTKKLDDVELAIQQARQEGRDDVLAILENDYPEEAQSIKQALKGSKEKMK